MIGRVDLECQREVEGGRLEFDVSCLMVIYYLTFSCRASVLF